MAEERREKESSCARVIACIGSRRQYPVSGKSSCTHTRSLPTAAPPETQKPKSFQDTTPVSFSQSLSVFCGAIGFANESDKFQEADKQTQSPGNIPSRKGEQTTTPRPHLTEFPLCGAPAEGKRKKTAVGKPCVLF